MPVKKYTPLRIFPDAKDSSRGKAVFGDLNCLCSLGKGGVKEAGLKREGDGATPIGLFWPETIFFRADRVPPPKSKLPAQPLQKVSGWCEAPNSPVYNRYVSLPHPDAAEGMWRADHLYDLVLVISHNRYPVRPGYGSAIFFHLARPGFSPTRGCVAFEKEDFLSILERLEPKTLIRVHPTTG